MSRDNPYETPQESGSGGGSAPRTGTWARIALLILLVGAAGLLWFLFRDALTLENLARREAELRELQQQHPILVYVAAFAIYVIVTGLSLPGATVLTLVYGWYFKFTTGVILVSFASTTGATVAFLASRYLFRDAVQRRFGNRLEKFNRSLEHEGPFFLFTLRLIPLVPFFVINLLMGLTPIRARTFWWVSQLGMLAGTAVYVYAGASVPSLQVLAKEGVNAVFSPAQLLQMAFAFSLLGVFPLAVRWGFKLLRRGRPEPLLESDGDASANQAREDASSSLKS
jgi:uncharacterized membrane protein YdjX (TVP38/TMEM64 family)